MESANIGTEGIERRLRGAVLAFGLALALITGLRLAGAPAYAFGLAFIPFFVASSLGFQSLYRTCTYQASHGTRNLGDGEEPVAHPEERARLARQGRIVWLLTLGTASLATALVVAAARG